ncbi:MAG: tRNA (guanosine(37)-N1)-methyltransferase TrmD [Alphaproteobacteria bacterium]|nr:tRNA (guanosine(37)-N1)-methyltransferase TrmD [Alphaproteobacteria bacterium]
MWQTNIFTIFPNAFPGTLGVSTIGKALELKKWNLNVVDLKKFPFRNDRIDAYPYGGGVGMLLSPLTFEQAFNSLDDNQRKFKRIYCSPRGRQLKQQDLSEISQSPGVTILCGRYEGVDQRILDFYEFEEISIGDFVLLGGEVAAMTIVEGCVRLLPGIVGDMESINDDSFQQNLLEHNQYTKPAIFKNISVPEVLLSGNHQQINTFQTNLSKMITMKKRPDLWAKYISKNMKTPKVETS